MSRIAIDCRFGSVKGGLGTYVRGLVPALIEHAGHRYQFFLLTGDPHESWLSPLSSNPAVEIVLAPYPHYSIAEQLQLPFLLHKLHADLLLVPHFNVPVFSRVPCVVAIHDLILHQFPNQTPLFKRLVYRLLFAATVRKARRIVTVSDATKHDLLSSFSCTEGKVTTVYPGISPLFRPSSDDEVSAVRQRYALPEPYFLYVGNAKEHKNVQLLINSFVAAGVPDHKLVLVTAGKEVSSLRISDCVRILPSVSDEDLPHLLSGAVAVVTASKMEGFCLPLVEAMACGTPVLASNTGPIPEVTRGHANLIAPTLEAFSDGFQRMATSPHVRLPERLLSAREFAASYAWENAGRQVLDVIEASLKA